MCDDHRDNIDSKILKKVQDISIKRNAEDYLKCMKPITVALDKVQSDTCKISDAVEVWKELSHDMEASQSLNVARKVQHCFGQALTDVHYLANTIDPCYMGKSLSSAETDAALEFCSQN